MPLPSSRMTKQPIRPKRYYPGKAYTEDIVSDEEDSDEDSDEELPSPPKLPPPKATSFPSRKSLATESGSGSAIAPTAHRVLEEDLSGFVTASESSDDDGDDGASSGEKSGGDSSEEEAESSSDDEPHRPMLAPRFIPKAQRAQLVTVGGSHEQNVAEEEGTRRAQADELLQAQIDRDAAERTAGKRYWDDDDMAAVDEVNDTDDLNDEGERAKWELRELKRVQRDRAAIIEKEKEREEIERRRNMTAEEREAEDRDFLQKQTEESEGRGKMSYMQRYHHKGAFFAGDEQDEEVKAVLNRNFAGARFEDETGDKAVLPEYMRIRDMTKLGKKGRTKYTDLRSEDTGRWGQMEGKSSKYDLLDERFRPDERREGRGERTGANSAPLGERRRKADEEDDRTGEGKRARYG